MAISGIEITSAAREVRDVLCNLSVRSSHSEMKVWLKHGTVNVKCLEAIYHYDGGPHVISDSWKCIHLHNPCPGPRGVRHVVPVHST